MLVVLIALMLFLAFWAACTFPRPALRLPLAYATGFTGLLPISDPDRSSADPLQQRWGLRPIAHCGAGA